MVYTTTPIEVPIHRYRVMFTDGHVEDFLSSRDDSDKRGFMLTTHWGPKGPPNVRGTPLNAIASVVDMGVEYVHTPAVKTIDTDKPRRRLRATPPVQRPGVLAESRSADASTP